MLRTDIVDPNELFFPSETSAQSGSFDRNFYRQHLRNFYLKKPKIREYALTLKENLHIPTQNFVAARNFYGSKI